MKNVVIATITGLGLFFVAAQANAACRIKSGSSSTFTLTINIALGEMVVDPSWPNGRVFKTLQTSTGSKRHVLECRDTSYRRAYIDKKNFAATPWYKVFKTNVPGVGVRIVTGGGDGGGNMASGTLPYSAKLGKAVDVKFPGHSVKVELMKIGDMQEGRLESGNYGSEYFDGINQASSLFRVSGSIKIKQPTCALGGDKNRTIALNPVSRNNFNAVGSTLGEKAFNIDLNCASGNAGKVGLMFDFNAHPNNNAVIQNAASSAVKAQGVDLQLISDYQNTVTAITKGMKLALGNVEANKAQNFIIPMRARYIQSESNVTAGEVNGSATMTIQYN